MEKESTRIELVKILTMSLMVIFFSHCSSNDKNLCSSNDISSSIAQLKKKYNTKLERGREFDRTSINEFITLLDEKKANILRKRLICYDLSLSTGLRVIVYRGDKTFIEFNQDSSIYIYYSIKTLKERIDNTASYSVYKPNIEIWNKRKSKRVCP